MSGPAPTRSAITTHVLDAARGQPAANVPVLLEQLDAQTARVLATGSTDADGRVQHLGPPELPVGVYRLTFDTGSYFRATAQEGFYPSVTITFHLSDPSTHYHVPVLLSPFAFSTYRGS